MPVLPEAVDQPDQQYFDGADPASDARNRMVTLREELFVAPAREQGCMRWGMCETSSPGDEEQDEFSRLWKLAIDS